MIPASLICPTLRHVTPRTPSHNVGGENNMLDSLDEQLTQEELSAYLPRFVEEWATLGREGGMFSLLPSPTEVLFLNETFYLTGFSGAPE